MKTGMMIILSLMALSAGAQTRRDTPSKVDQQSGITVVGNGGDVVDCGEKEPLLLLDIYEMKLVHRDLDYRIQGKDEEEKIKHVLNQISKVSKYQAKILKVALDQYAKNSVPERDLVDIPDSQHIFFPEGCQVRQIVIQTRVNGVSHFKVDPDLLERLDIDMRIYLALHEANYAEAIDLGHKNSIGTRALTRFMAPIYRSGHMIDFLMQARAKNGFPIFDEMSNGDVAVLDPSKYDKLYNRYGQKITGRKTYNPKAIHFSNGKSLYVKNNEKLEVDTSNDGSKIKSLEGTALDPKLFNLPDDIKDISKINFENKTVVTKSTVYVTFDGHRYACAANQDMPIGDGKVTTCIGNTDSQTLPVRFTKRLLNNSKSYLINFRYNDDEPSGIKFTNRDTKWRMGFTPREDLQFKSYEEDWNTQRLTLDLEFERDARNTVKVTYGSSSVECELFSGKTVFSMKNPYPFILEGHVWFTSNVNKEKNIIEYTGCSIPTGSTSYRLKKFKRDENGNLISGEFMDDAKVSFAGTTTRVRNPVFKDNRIVSAIPMEGMKAYYNRNYRGLIPGLVYNVLANGGSVEMVPNPEIIKKTPEGWWQVQQRLGPGTSYGAGMIATLAESKAGGDQEVQINLYDAPVFTEDLTLIQGVLLQPAKLPVCKTNEDSEETEITVRNVEERFEIKARRLKTPKDVLCYWIRDLKRK